MSTTKYLSVCSGIEAATVAWHELGWKPFAFSEIENFPAAVLAHHYPNVPNLGDMTKFKEWPDAAVDVLVGGTPCQSFSVAGLRKGLDDPRGNLMLTYLAIADKYRPRWLVWENVPGVLSSNGGRDFACFLRGLAELGYGFAYRILDAQYFGVAQRRRRVFVVGCLGDWRRAAAVLFERQSLSGDPAPSRKAGKDVAGSTGDGIARCLTTGEAKRQDWETCNFVAHSLRGEGFDASEDGSGRGTPLVPIAFPAFLSGTQCAATENLAPALGAENPTAVAFDWKMGEKARSIAFSEDQSPTLGAQADRYAVAFQSSQSGVRVSHVHATLDCNNGSRRHNGLDCGMGVRRLTPRECERLQGFPDDYTLIPTGTPRDSCFHGGVAVQGDNGEWIYFKPAADGPRYKALGNSMAVPVMRWIGCRIAMADALFMQSENIADKDEKVTT